MLKWSTTRSNGRVIGDEIRKRLDEEKMSLASVQKDDYDDVTVTAAPSVNDGVGRAAGSVVWSDLGSVTSAQSAARKWTQIQRGGAES